MPLPTLTIIVAAILILLAAGGYIVSSEITATFPGMLGVLLGICGGLALWQESWRRHAMHVACVLALLGVLLPLGRLVPVLIRGESPSALALFALLSMLVLSAVLLVIYIRSFIAARRGVQEG